MSPLALYQDKLKAGEFQEDDAQVQVLARLEDLFSRFNQRQPRPSFATKLRRLFAREEKEVVKGLYIWGGVGRGKTMMMDLFYDCLAPERRLRMHFHRFMKRVHDGLKRYSGTANPLQKVAAEFAEETDILCFDEFFVSDIGDAMILAELMEGLFSRGVTLVATSNVEPANLYENGLQRRRFLPAIDLLYAHTEVYHMPDGIDFRLRALEQAEIYHSSLDGRAEESLLASLRALAPHEPKADVTLTIEGRDIRARFESDDIVWFEFSELCEGPRSQNDYIELAMVYHAVFVSNIPVFDSQKENAARRFISLVDEFYDHGVKLIVSAAATIPELYQGERLRFEFDRTESRLFEMQSTSYLGASHLREVES
ncbi:MAG: cell division protein ZapE [Pseudomonadales bacterium]|nr:cell division protein ZapE [Pseudomonadales bacterium]